LSGSYHKKGLCSSTKTKIPSFGGDQFFVLGVVVAFSSDVSPDNGRLDFQGLVLVVSKDWKKEVD
jgi:hypothetical protein